MDPLKQGERSVRTSTTTAAVGDRRYNTNSSPRRRLCLACVDGIAQVVETARAQFWASKRMSLKINRADKVNNTVVPRGMCLTLRRKTSSEAALVLVPISWDSATAFRRVVHKPKICFVSVADQRLRTPLAWMYYFRRFLQQRFQ